MKNESMIALLLLLGAGLSQAQQTRIVGGNTTTAGAYPYMTALIEKGTAPSSGQFCGAALVAPQWVLTAGHCMEGTPASSVEVWIGGRDLRNAAEGIRVGVSQVIMHPNYGENAQGALVNDFCLLKLSRAVTERATLPLVETSSQIAAGITSRVIGWGATSEGGSGSSVLLQVDLPLVSLATAGQTNPGLGAMHLAAGRASGGIDSCQGDSGGPLMVRNAAGQWAHGGTVSYGNGCAQPGQYGIYGNTLSVKTWITNNIGSTPTPTDDHLGSTSTTSILAINGSSTGTLEVGGDRDVFRLTPANSGTLTLSSSGSTDVVGQLLNASGTLLLTDDNSAGGPNFRITRTLTAGGTYFLRVSGKTATTTGGYGVAATLSGSPATNGDIDVMNGAVSLALGNSIDFGSRAVNSAAITKNLTIVNRGTAALAINSASASPSGSFTVNTQPAKTLAVGAKTTFIVGFKPQAAGALSATLIVSSNDPDENPFILTLTGTGTSTTSADQGNTIATAAAVKLPSTISASIESGTDIDVFKFTLTATKTVTLQTTGSIDTYGTLYNRSGAVILEADDTDTDVNFRISRSLSAGTYYLAVEGYSTDDVGAYTLSLQ